MYLCVLTVPNEREDRVKVCETRKEAVDHAMKLKQHVYINQGKIVKCKVFRLEEPTETF